MRFYLIVAKGKRQGLPIPIEVDLFMIGSAPECQLRAQHDMIGTEHCALITRGRKVFVRDFNSGHPTMVNGEAIPPGEEWPLHAGDRMDIGPLSFMIQYREKTLSQRDLEEWAVRCLDEDATRKQTIMDRLEQVVTYTKEAEDASHVAAAILDRMQAKRGIVKGRLRIAREENVTIVRVNDLYLVEDAELALIKRELHENLNRPNLRVLMDLKNIKRMSSTGAEMFAELARWLKPFGSRMAICRLRPDLQQLMLGLPDCEGLRFFNDKPAALTANW
jgi:anti-anti-sigma regulatory factor